MCDMQKLMFTNAGPRVQTTQQYLTTCRIQGVGSADGTTITQVILLLLNLSGNRCMFSMLPFL